MELGSIAGIGSALTSARIESELSAIGVATQIEVLRDAGQNAIQLIQAATLDTTVGQHLDVSV